MNSKLTYKDAGVDIDAGDKTVNYIKPLAKSTYRKEVMSGVGGFSGLFNIPDHYKNKDIALVASTDGVGTKLKLAFKTNNHKTIGIDLVAMCVNDILCCGAEPLFFLDYFACNNLNPKQARDIIYGICEGCKKSKCTLLGGETAELPGMYFKNEYDLAGFVIGIVEKKKIIDGRKIKPGDILIGIESSGLHSNGYSLAQKVFFDIAKWDLNYKHKELKKEVSKALLTPTIIYVDIIEKLKNKFKLKGIANITGGGLTENIPRVIPKNCNINIDLNSWKRPKLFKLMQGLGNIEDDEMLRTFNNGIGMVLIINKNDSEKIIREIKKNKLKAYKIGYVSNGKNKVIYKGNF